MNGFENHALATRLPDVPAALLDEYFGVWAVEETRFRQAVERLCGIDLIAHVQRHRAAYRPMGIAARSAADRIFNVTREGVALIHLRGPMMKFASSLSNGSSTVFARRQIRAAIADDQVAGITIRMPTIKSPAS